MLLLLARISSGAVPGILHVLKNGSIEAQANVAATIFFSLKAVDEYRGMISALGAIPIIVTVLREGIQREPGGKMVDKALAIVSMVAGHPDGKAAGAL
ncbi:hypothetical protein F0562_016334 [Nyssa sinensis]|uniref:U-box domain-containing protein n=1 Tax=Nyssa sinensis TaxID=561372 RepID=A0A5J4ZN31_9ASTE|nr:hypothetical protein F0562_016334 [Nyssa sinensis]